ncbi:alkene reductase [Pseudoduganella sp. GCM10020061]|uniref:alkene reductase n=1 Tax=Pseudoduganella sp. GCM10020061 TaxID=3317345 RepID=UPI0036436497
MNTNGDTSTDLFEPYKMGPLQLKNRMVMPPLTRSRAEAGNVPSRYAADYYSQRAGAGLIIAEATQAEPHGQGYISTPGIHSPEQIAGWKKVTDAVHAKGGLIFLQIWHVGRISHPDFLDGELPVAPSAIAPRGVQTYTPDGQMKDVPTPRALETHEVSRIVENFQQGARNARQAGFDGVEVHGANGYLLDQFLEDCTNRRNDQYGGPVENRARLLLEVTDAVIEVWGSDRVGVRLSPGGTFNDMCDAHPQETWGYVVRELAKRKLAYLHLIEPVQPVGEHPMPDLSVAFFRPMYPGTIIVAGGYDHEKGKRVLESGNADLVAYGQAFIANPDLPERFRMHAPLNPPNRKTFYGGGPEGYVDYPTLEQVMGSQPQSAGGQMESSGV